MFAIRENFDKDDLSVGGVMTPVFGSSLVEKIYQSSADMFLGWQAVHGETLKQVAGLTGQQYEGIIEYCLKYRDLMRSILEANDLLYRACRLEPPGLGETIGAVDSSVRQVDSYFNTTVVGHGVSCNTHRDVLNVVGFFNCPQNFSLSILVDYLRCYLEAILLTPIATERDYAVILDQSYAVVLSTVVKSVQNYYHYVQELAGKQVFSDLFAKKWNEKLISGLNKDGIFPLMFANSKVIGVTKSAVSQSIVRFLQLRMKRDYNIESFCLNLLVDRRLLDFILDPGEYINPQVLSLGNRRIYAEVCNSFESLPYLMRQSYGSIPDLLAYFAENSPVIGKSGGELDEVASKIHYTYYRPYQRDMVYRLEFHGSWLFDGKDYNSNGLGQQFQQLLNTLNYSFTFGFMEPDTQYLADKLAKDAVAPWDKLVEVTLANLQTRYLSMGAEGVLPLAVIDNILQFLSTRYRT